MKIIKTTDDTNSKQIPGVLVSECRHCEGSGECLKGKTIDKIHSCEYCVNKSTIKIKGIFPKVPCGYCDGKGYHIIDLKPQRSNENKGGRNNARKQESK